MDRQEIEEQIEKFKQFVTNARSNDDWLTYAAGLAKWENMLKQYDLKDIEQREVRYEKRMKGKNAEWHEWAKSLYLVEREGGSYRVRSTARDWQTDMSWLFKVEIEAKEKVEQLINYKIKDRDRGRGDVNKDLSEV